jgi:hypothetical protein
MAATEQGADSSIAIESRVSDRAADNANARTIADEVG